MSIISGNRHDRRDSRHHAFTDANMRAALNHPAKRALKEMLAEAARNTAALPVEQEPGAREYQAPIASAADPSPQSMAAGAPLISEAKR